MATTDPTPTPTTVTRDAADILVSKLNELDGIKFTRDAWENKAPDNYGVVELTGETSALWADDRMTDQLFQLTVHIYVTGGDTKWIRLVQEKLAAASEWYSLPSHEYAYDINKNHWTWNCMIYGPMQWDEVVTDG